MLTLNEFALSVNKLVCKMIISFIVRCILECGSASEERETLILSSSRHIDFIFKLGGSMLVIGSDVMPGVKTQIRSASLAKDRGICHDRLWTAV